ncbi:MAG: replicative DNA helicase, partial [Candidatus Saccharimonadales bacterium]
MQNSKQRYNAPKADEPPLIYGKIPPQASDLEQAVLGACMLEVMAFDKISGILTPECFYKDAHVKIFSSMRSLADKSQPIDLLTVFAELQKSGELEAVGGASYITTLTNIVASTAHLEDHARIVLEKHIKREQIRVGSSMIVDGYDDTKDALEALDEAEEKLFSISGFTLKKDFEHISRGLFENMKKIEALRNREYSLTGVPTGFKRLDRITNGWQNTDLVIIAARPSVGKSALALNLAINAVFNPDKPTPTAIFSLEMSTGQLINRMLSSITKIPLEWLQNGSLSEGKMIQLQRDGYDRLNEAPIYIDDTAGMTMFELRSKCRRMKSKHGIGLVIIDYLQLMDGEDKRGNREQEISKISRSLKGMAKDLEIPVIALSQMSRDVEKRGGTPRLSDLRECLAVNSSLIYSDDGLFHNSQMAMRLLSLSKEGRTGITDSFNIPKTYNTVYRLKTRTGRYVDCTENHPILTSSGYKRLKDITMEDAVAVALNWENSNGEYIPEAKFIGWMIGNGCMCGYNVPSFITRDKEISDRFVSFIENRFSFTPKIHRHNISKVYQWDMTESSVRTKEGNPVTNWLKEHNLWGEKAYGKKIPDWFLRAANAQSITELIQGLWETDGCVVFGNRKYLKYSTISFELANQILYLLAGLGIVANLSDGYLSNNANYPIYEVIIDYDEGIKIFKNKIALDGYKG